MMSLVHPNSFISKEVELGSNVKIGPFCYLKGNIKIDDNTELKSHVVVSGNTSIGKNNIFYAGAYLGYGFHEDGYESGVKVSSRINNIFND